MNQIKEYDKKAQDRILALADLVTLMETLPVAREITFSDTYDDHLRLGLASTAEFDAWAKHLGALVTYRDYRHGDTVQCHGYASWSGWSLYIGTCVRDPEPEPAAVMPAGSVLPSQADGSLDYGIDPGPAVAAAADDGCIPFLELDTGRWSIGGGACPLRSAHSTAEYAVSAHNSHLKALLRELEKAELDGAAAELASWESLPALAPADIAELNDTEPDAATADDHVCTVPWCDHATPPKSVPPVRVGDERVAEICAALDNTPSAVREIDDCAEALPEFVRVVERTFLGVPCEIELTGNVRIYRNRETLAWSVTR